ncbi:3'-5' exoribonuclease [Micrococcales bacterium 31B]|nr:3'-5' exoribonuclease [Micrococcales bacterium 31B]
MRLADVTFVVLDLETTGGQSSGDAITEIGAVKVRGGARIGTFQTLIDPGIPIPYFITRLTGISNAMVQGQPRIETVLGSLFDFVRDAVVVAHNAPFDIGFLRAAARRHDIEWPQVPVLDTVRLSRALMPAGTVPNHKLGTLASYIGTEVTPNHRALDDACATSDVLHYLIEIAGGQGLHTFDQFAGVTTKLHRIQTAKRHLASGVPSGPGVYRFIAPDGEVLYIGMSGNLAFRVANYFSGSEKRSRMMDLIAATERIETTSLPTRLEAEVVEARLLREVRPHYNVLDKQSGSEQWLRVLPRGAGYSRAVARVLKPEGLHLGPFGQRQEVLDAASALDDALPDATYEQVRHALTVDSRALVEPLRRAMLEASEAADYELAGRTLRRLQCVLRGARARQQWSELERIDEIVAAERGFEGTWDLALVRRGLLIATAHVARGQNPHLAVAQLLADHPTETSSGGSRGSVGPGSVADAPALLGAWAERRIVARWLERDLTRLVHLQGEWSSPSLANFDAPRALSAGSAPCA